MASFDDDNDPAAASQDEDDNEDEEMEDVNDGDQDGDQDMDQGGDDDEDDGDGGDDDDDNDDDNEGDEDDDQAEPDSPSRETDQSTHAQNSTLNTSQKPAVVLTSPSPRGSAARSPGNGIVQSYIPPTRPEALIAQAYDIVPTMAAPQSTSINAITATPDMRWVFSGGSDGYVRMYNWVETANGKVPLTVAQKHPFVDSVMKAGSLLTYWENEETTLRTPPSHEEGKWTSPVYSLAVQHQALWLLSGLESGGINLQTCRHGAGTRITTLKEHTSAVSVLSLSQDETNLLSGSWDKNIIDWDMNSGKVKRMFKGASGQISAIETRPLSDLSVPEVSGTKPENLSDTFSSNNADNPSVNGYSNRDGGRASGMGKGDEDAMGSPDGSLFGEGDHGSLFGDDPGAGGGGTAFGDDDDDLTRALESEMEKEQEPPDADIEISELGNGGPVQPPAPLDADAMAADPILPDTGAAEKGLADSQLEPSAASEQLQQAELARPSSILTQGLPHSDEPLTAPPTNDDTRLELPPKSESTFLDTSIDGSIRIWDRRVAMPVATILPQGSPWVTGACWSPDGNFFYAGRKTCSVDEYSIHHLGSKRNEPNRSFKFQPGSGPVYAVRAMPNKKHLVCASNDILRIYDLVQPDNSKHSRVPFNIVPGHRGGVVSAIHIDPSCRFMLSASGTRGWEGNPTEVLLGYEIGVQDEKGIWHK